MELSLQSTAGYAIPCHVQITDSAKQIVVALHGFGGSKDTGTLHRLERALEEKQIGFFSFDFPCHGQSDAPEDAWTLAHVLSDIHTVCSYLEHTYPKADLCFFATSFGAYALAIYQSMHPNQLVAKTVFRSAAVDMKRILDEKILVGREAELKKEGSIAVTMGRTVYVTETYYKEVAEHSLAECFVPNTFSEYLMIHGTSDELAPLADARAFSEKFGLNLVEITGADHRFKRQHDLEQMIHYAVSFFQN